MKSYIKALLKISISIAILLVTWFGLGAWLTNQPSNLLYLLGIAVNILIVIPVAYIIKSVFKGGN